MPAKPSNIAITSPETQEEWETVAEARTKMIFDADGDVFIGYFEGPEVIIDPNTSEKYNYLNFRDDTGTGFTTSAGYQLSRAFDGMPQGTFVKITRLGTTKVSEGNTMTNFRVQVRKN